MVATRGLSGLRPSPKHVRDVVTPPYDVIKDGSGLRERLLARPDSLYHVILGGGPAEALQGLVARGALLEDREPAYYVYEQSWTESGAARRRLGVLLATAVSPYEEGQIIRHEKTFDDKVQGRIALAAATQHTTGPVFLLTRAALDDAIAPALGAAPLYDFNSDFGGGTDLQGVRHRVWRLPEADPVARAIAETLRPESLYIADGHHRYHAALRGGQTHTLAYVTAEARILAYDRVIRGVIPFERARADLDLEPADAFETPPKHRFRILTKDGCWSLRAKAIPADAVGRLDCAILERELYPRLGLTPAHITDPRHFDYYPETALEEMRAEVAAGRYELAVALHPVSQGELLAVADAGLRDASVVMPEKSTFFSPKILTGLFLYRHTRHAAEA